MLQVDQVRLKEIEIELLKVDHDLMIQKLKEEHKCALDQGGLSVRIKFLSHETERFSPQPRSCMLENSSALCRLQDLMDRRP